MITKTVLHTSYGYCAEVYDDDDADNPKIGYWYGTWQECAALDPSIVELHPAQWLDRPDPFDLACERRLD